VPASVALSRHRPGRRTDAGRVSDAGVRSGGSLPGGVRKCPRGDPSLGVTLSNLRTRPLRGGGRVEGHGGDAGSGGVSGLPMRPVRPAWTANAESRDRYVAKTSRRERRHRPGTMPGRCRGPPRGPDPARIWPTPGSPRRPASLVLGLLGPCPRRRWRVGTMTRVRVRHPVWRNRAAKCTAPEPFAGIGRLGPGLRARRLEPIAGGDERRAWKSRFDGTARRLAPDRPARYRTRQG
jgi:hypothetical protein